MTTYFNDTFSGTGSLFGHAPDVGFAGQSWQDAYIGDMSLAGGFATNVDPSPGLTGAADYGANATNFGAPGTVTVNFSFRSPSDITPTANRLGARIEITVGAKAVSVYLGADGATWGLALYGAAALTPVTLAASTTYAGVIDIANGAQTLVFMGQTLTGVLTYYDNTGFSRVQLEVGDTSAVGPITVEGAVVVGSGNAALSSPTATAKAYGGGRAALVAPAGALSATASLDAGHAVVAVAAPSPALFAHSGWRMALTAPSPTLTVTAHNSFGEQAAFLTAPSPVLSITTGANSRLTAPSSVLSTSATVTNWGLFEVDAPPPSLSASGTVSAMASAALNGPSPNLVGYGGAVCSVTLTGKATVQATGTTGAIGGAQISCPLFSLSAGGTAQNHGSASLLAPSAQLGAQAQAWLVAPGARLTAIGSAVVTATYEAYAINLNHNDPAANDEVTRYTNFPFTHVVRYLNSYYGANSTGLYLLEGATDDGQAVPWAFKTAMSDFKSPFLKTVVSAYFGGRFGAAATVDLYPGEDGAQSYSYATVRSDHAQNYRQTFGRGLKSRYYAIGASGADTLELDNIEFNTLNSTRRI